MPYTCVSSCWSTSPLSCPMLTEVRRHQFVDINSECELPDWTTWRNQLWVIPTMRFYAPVCIFLNHQIWKCQWVWVPRMYMAQDAGEVWFSLQQRSQNPLALETPIVLSFQIMFSTYPRMSLGRTHTESLIIWLLFFSFRQVNLQC